MVKVILISQVPLPYSKIGSWSTLYGNYLQHNNQIDYIVCPKPNQRFQNVEYSFVKEGYLQKIINKITKKRFINFCEALKKIIKPNEKYIIQVVDNFKIIPEIQNFLEINKFRNQCYIQFFYHGFTPFLSKEKSYSFFHSINEMVLLTKDSYKCHLEYYDSLPIRFSILNNGIDTNKFFQLSENKKNELKRIKNIKSKNVFIWCSQDRPKKGLDFILDVWKKVYSDNKEIELIVIGANRDISIKGVRFLGKIPNSQIAEYYQLSDVYLFPTLCQEGFGLTLIEALHSGCYCMASKIGGVPEVLNYGILGKLIDNPHFASEWVEAIELYLKNKPTFEKISSELYSKEKWGFDMDEIIISAKRNIV